MKIITINSGSSSIKFKLFDMPTQTELLSSVIEKIGEDISILTTNINKKKSITKIKLNSYKDAFKLMVLTLNKNNIKQDDISQVVHRVVHGGEFFNGATIIDKKVIAQIKQLIPLAPLHNPSNLLGIKKAQSLYPNAIHIAIFDTAFHQTLPNYAYRYAISNKFYKKDRIRRYGFHGTSHQYILSEMSKILKKKKPNLITLHIGNGISATAIKKGKSIDTTMGFTPLEGLIMGTRCGSIDPSIPIFLAKNKNLTFDEIDLILNKESGLKGLTDISDMRDIISLSKKGNIYHLAIEMFCYAIIKQIGAYIATLNTTIDAIVFTGGIGENSPFIREKILKNLNHLGIKIKKNKNLNQKTFINKKSSKIKIAVIPTNEELQMARLAFFNYSKDNNV